jgi:quercetin dioxygenase-like cupin family protein
MSFDPVDGFGYVRLYTGEDGESHFEDVTVSATQNDDVAVAAPIPLNSMIMRAVLAPDTDALPHNAPRRQFIVHLEGVVEVEASDGERRRFEPGDVVLVEDVSGRGHVTRWVSEGERRTLFLPLPD